MPKENWGKTWQRKQEAMAHARESRHPPLTEERREALRQQALEMQAKRWYKTNEDALKDRPELTPERAKQYVMLLRAGKPPYHALKSFNPSYYNKLTTPMRISWFHAWDRDDLVEEMRLTLAGINWELLTPAQRESIALDKHFGELAWFLMYHQFFSADGLKLVKMREARKALMERVTAHPDTTGPFAQLLRKLLHQSEKADHTLGAPAFYDPPPPSETPSLEDFADDPGDETEH